MAANTAQRDPWAIFPDAPAQAAAPESAAANDPWDQFPDADAAPAPTQPTATASPKSPSLLDQALDVVKGTAEVPLTVGSSAVAQPVSGLAGLGTMLGKFLGLTDAEPADVVRRSQEAMTYQPTSESGKGAMDLIAKPFEKFAEGAQGLSDKTFEATGSPALATAVRTAPDAALALLGARGAPKSAPRPALKPAAGSADIAGAAPKGGIPAAVGPRMPEEVKPAQTPVEIARAAGYKLKPSEAGGKKGAVAEGLSGAAKLERDLVTNNQQRTHALVAEELGLPADTQRFTPSVLNKAKAPHNAVYDEVGTKLGDWQASPEFVKNLDSALPTRGATAKVKEQVGNLIEQFNRPAWNGKDAIQEVRKLRQSSTKRIRSDDPDVQSFGYAERRVADAIEDEMTRQAQLIGEPDLMSRLASARESLAKIHTIDAARTGTEVSVPKLVAQAKKGKPLSGRLKLIADVGAEFPTVMRTTAGMKDKVPVNMTETLASGALSSLGHNLAAGATFLARPATRAILKSDAYQNRLAPQASKLGPNSPLGEYFTSRAKATEAPAPSAPVGPSVEFQRTTPQAGAASPEAMLEAQRLAGQLELQPEPVANGVELPQASARLGDLIAETPPPVRGDLPFTPSQPLAATLADELGLAPEIQGEGLTLSPSQPRAAGMAENVPGKTVFPELRAVRDRPAQAADELSLSDELTPDWKLREINRQGEAFDEARAAAAEEASGSYQVEPGTRQDVVLESKKTAAEHQATAPKGTAIEFSGDELGGLDQPMFELKSAARKYAREHFADKSVVNEIDGTEIEIPWQAIKHSTAGKVSKNAAIAISKLDELLQKAEPTGKAPDKQNRKDIAGAYYYDANISVGGEPAVIRAVVREHKDGHRYYDHFELLSDKKKSPAPGGGRPVQEVSGASAGRKDVRSGAEDSTSGEHIELSGTEVRRRRVPVEQIEAGGA